MILNKHQWYTTVWEIKTPGISLRQDLKKIKIKIKDLIFRKQNENKGG